MTRRFGTACNNGRPAFNPFLDLNSYTRNLLGAKKLGIFTIGGGVPRNWAQQVPPYIEILNMRLGTTLTPPRFHYGVRICPGTRLLGRTQWLHLSGGDFLGEIRSARTGGTIRRSVE